MDMVLARTLSVRPENKIAMRCPSWPDSPLHQYFGAKRTKRKDMDFVFSSLGYIRLYEACCPRETLSDQSAEPDTQSSFVHIEERLRSDGPFVPYRRPPQRRLGLGLTERAREKRLLKYYKYFQGFQRKLQVSRQFQQNTQKPQNKAKVKKIINDYKPNSALLPRTSASSQSKQPDLASLPPHSEQESTYLTKESPKSEAPAVIVKPGMRIKKDATVLDPTVNKRMAEMTAVLASLDSNANKFMKKKDRLTAIAPTLATIEENADDCEFSESEHNLIVDTQQVAAETDVTNKKHRRGKSAQRSIQNEYSHPRGILKHPLPAPWEQVSKNEEPVDKSPSTFQPPVADSSDLQTMKRQRTIRKLSRARKTPSDSVTSEILASCVGSEGQLEVKDAKLIKKVSQKMRRGHSALKRSFPPSTTASVRNISEKQGEDSPREFSEASNENISHVKSHEESADELFHDASGKLVKGKKTNLTSKRKSRTQIKFTGWDFGTSLDTHSLEELPDEKDLTDQLLKRAERSMWAANPQSVIVDEDLFPIPPVYDPKANDPIAYLQEHDIQGIFMHFTKDLMNAKSHQPFQLLQEISHDLAVQHEQKMRILSDLNLMRDISSQKNTSRESTVHRSLTKSVLSGSYMQPIEASDQEQMSPPMPLQQDSEDYEIGQN